MSDKVKALIILGGTFLFLFMFVFFKAGKFEDDKGRGHFFQQDIDQYYSYLPAYFIYDDLSFNFDNEYWLMEAPNGERVPKVTMGMAFTYAPWFLIADGIAQANPEYERDGYSEPYVTWVRFGVYFYFFLGLFFLSLALLKFFKPHI